MFDALGDVESAIEKLLAAEGRIDVVRLSKALTRLEYAWVATVGEYDRSGDWRAEGFVNAAAALRAKTGVAHGVARGALEMAAKLRELPLLSEAFAAGDVTRRQAEIVTKACTPERAAALSEIEAALVDAARVATPRAFAQIVARVSDAIDGDDGASSAWQKYQRRRLHVSKTLDGMVVGDFVLDPEDGDFFLRSLSAMQRQDSPRGDARRPEQKRADAFMDLVRTGAAHAAAGPGRHSREFVVPIDLSEIEARGGRAIAEEVRVHHPSCRGQLAGGSCVTARSHE